MLDQKVANNKFSFGELLEECPEDLHHSYEHFIVEFIIAFLDGPLHYALAQFGDQVVQFVL